MLASATESRDSLLKRPKAMTTVNDRLGRGRMQSVMVTYTETTPLYAE